MNDVRNPFPAEHAARLREPGAFQRIRQLWRSDGVRGLGGPLRGRRRGAVLQTIRFDATEYSPRQAKTWLREHGYVARGFERATGRYASGKRVAVKRNPSLLVLSNPRKTRSKPFRYWVKVGGEEEEAEYFVIPLKRGEYPPAGQQMYKTREAAQRDVEERIRRWGGTQPRRRNPTAPAATRRAYKNFHMSEPHEELETWVPDGWPTSYVVIGRLDKLEVDGESHRPGGRVCMTSGGKCLYLLGGRYGSVTSGHLTRIDYSVPAHSGRTKWATRWWHPSKGKARVSPHGSGRAAKISGGGLKVTERGIEG